MLYESERKIMDILWMHGSIKAAELVKLMNEKIGWNRNTTYTVLKKCVDKRLVKRSDPGYICSPIVSRRQIQRAEMTEFLEKSFDGSVIKLFSALTAVKPLSKYEVKEIRRIAKEKTVSR